MRGVALLSDPFLDVCPRRRQIDSRLRRGIVSVRTVQGTAIRPNGNEVLYVVTERPIHSPGSGEYRDLDVGWSVGKAVDQQPGGRFWSSMVSLRGPVQHFFRIVPGTTGISFTPTRSGMGKRQR